MIAELIREPGWLLARFAAPQQVLSWGIVGGGRRLASVVAWHQVKNDDLTESVDPVALLEQRLRARTGEPAVGLLTSADLAEYVDVTERSGGVAARCIATVGLGNAVRVGDTPGTLSPGTINLLVHVSTPLGEAAQLEAIALCAEARTLGVLEGAVPSLRSGLPATGTGTDCIVIASPPGETPERYAGKHTLAGHLIGAVVLAATRRGVARWKQINAA